MGICFGTCKKGISEAIPGTNSSIELQFQWPVNYGPESKIKFSFLCKPFIPAFSLFLGLKDSNFT